MRIFKDVALKKKNPETCTALHLYRLPKGRNLAEVELICLWYPRSSRSEVSHLVVSWWQFNFWHTAYTGIWQLFWEPSSNVCYTKPFLNLILTECLSYYEPPLKKKLSKKKMTIAIFWLFFLIRMFETDPL